ncbi:MAG: hypothetical protein HY073_00755, partial [Deltaproteobacteria bacterium]|nr:hypothetical protein [Deltaproteobacteria bacterium]
LFLLNYLTHQKHLQENKNAPDYYLGHSLGEFNALNAAGVFDFETGLKIVQKRGELMFSIGNTGMAAIVGAEYKEVKEILLDELRLKIEQKLSRKKNPKVGNPYQFAKKFF